MMVDSQWHLDKRVPLSLIFMILMQTAGAFWWASSVDSELTRLKDKTDVVTVLNERVIRLEEQQKIGNKLLQEIRDELRSQ